MKLAKIRIENFRQLGANGKPFELDFTDAFGRVRDFTLLVGPNTCGKTTILDAIAAALSQSLGMTTLRQGFTLSPRTVVTRKALQTKITCWLRFESVEIETTRALIALEDSTYTVPDDKEIELTWSYPDPRGNFGFTRCTPKFSWTLFKSRVTTAKQLSTGRVSWDWFRRAGSVFTFDQERTSLGKTISRQVWNIIHGQGGDTEENSVRWTTDARTILIDLAIQSLVKSTENIDSKDKTFERIVERYSHVCEPRRIVGAIRDDLGELDIYFSDGRFEYRYDGLSSGEKMVLLLLVRFVAEHIHRSIVLIDELELNQHPIWQRKILHMLPKMGDNNQIIATTHSPYLRDAVPQDCVIDLGELGDYTVAEAK